MRSESSIPARALSLLKRALNEKDMTYSELAHRLDVSVATVKRFMNGGDTSLGRFIDVCSILEVTPGEVLECSTIDPIPDARWLTEEQEEFFIKHPHHLGYFMELGSGKSPGAIARRFSLSKRSTDTYLVALSDAGFIKILPGRRVKILVLFSGGWRPGGPLVSKFMRNSLRGKPLV